MDNMKRDPLRKLKEEADHCLFADLQFDATLRDRVRQSVLEELKLIEEESCRSFMEEGSVRPTTEGVIHQSKVVEGRSDTNKWWAQWKKWTLVATATAAMACALLLTIPEFQGNVVEGPPEIETVPWEGGIMTAPVENDPSSGGNIPMISTMSESTFENMEEARLWFGEVLAEASYIPDSYRLEAIYGRGQLHREATVVLQYTSGQQSYQIIQQRQELTPILGHGEEVDINGVKGIFDQQGGDGIQLHWSTDEIYYSVTGFLSKEEALRIARSMQ